MVRGGFCPQMSVATLPTEESIAARVQQKLARIRERRSELIGERALAWLALVPVWSVPVASACRFPSGDKSLEEFLTTAEAIGLVVQERPSEMVSARIAAALQRNYEHQFWMPDAQRSRTLTELRDRLGPSALLEEVQAIVKRVPATTSLPALDQWTELAMLSVKAIGLAADKLRDNVRELLDRSETGAALALLRTASLLAQALGGELESAVLRSRREVEVAYRRAHDRRALEGFLERDEQIRAFEDLARGPDHLWATHFLGMGGAGKTMLIRHINAELAAKHDRITARVDFDYMSPNYPLLRPEQLLVELADELRAYSAPEEFARFEDRVHSLQEEMSRRTHDSVAGDPLDTAEFRAVQRAFRDWLAKLPRKVVLILDTCEELAKLQPGGQMAPSIRATYRILEELHAEIPSLRIIFAGRRPLALAGHGWKLRTDALSEGRRHLPPQKDYLRLHLLRGFAGEETDEYFRRQGVAPRGELREAILENSRESPAIVNLIEGEEAGIESRSNPFDLSLYVQWLHETPQLTAAFIRSGRTDPYIDLRIARRLNDSVRELLPAVAFLGRFDEAMLRPAAPLLNDAAFADVFRELAEQEWIDYQLDEGGSFLQVDRNLHPRLLGYFAADLEQLRLFDHARHQLAPGLAHLVRERISAIQPQATAGAARQLELGFDLVHASLRALGAEPAAELWEEIEARIVATGRWDWAATITGRLLGEQEAGELDQVLRAAVLATQASAMLHTEPGATVAKAWENVVAIANDAWPPERAQAIEQRAWLGKIAASPPEAITSEDVTRLTQLWAQLDETRGERTYDFEQVAASLWAATETVVDAIEKGGKFEQLLNTPGLAYSIWALHSGLEGSISPELRAFGFTLCSRLHRDKGCRQEAEQAVSAAVEAASVQQEGPPQRWAGWRAPDSIADFARLEQLLHFRWFAEADASSLLEKWPETIERIELLDAERLVSLRLELLLGERVPQTPELERLEQLDRYSGPSSWERTAHRSVAPLVVNLALGWAARGNADRALALLDTRIEAAKAKGSDSQTILQCQQAKLRVISRMRLRRRGESLMERSVSVPELAALGWPARALNGLAIPQLPVDDAPIARETLHAWWRSRINLDERSRPKLAAQAQENFRHGAEDGRTSTATMFADYAERDWLEVGGLPARWGSERPEPLQEAIGELRARSAIPSRELVRLNLRLAALCREGWLPDQNLVGRRRLAELAFEEGELLALRLPDLAMRPLDLAHEYFSGAVDDRVGALIAAICGATAALRRNAKNNVSWRLAEKVRPAYERLVSDGAWIELPSWQELENLVNDPRADLQRLNHPVWGGWLHRLFRSFLWLETGKTDRQFAWLARQYGDQVPVELGFSPKEMEMTRKIQRVARSPDRFFRACLRWCAILFLLGIGAGIVLSILELLEGARFAVTWLMLLSFPLIGTGLLFVAFVVATIKAISAVRAAHRRLALSVDLDSSVSSLDFSATRPVQIRVLEFKSRSDPARRRKSKHPRYCLVCVVIGRQQRRSLVKSWTC